MDLERDLDNSNGSGANEILPLTQVAATAVLAEIAQRACLFMMEPDGVSSLPDGLRDWTLLTTAELGADEGTGEMQARGLRSLTMPFSWSSAVRREIGWSPPTTSGASPSSISENVANSFRSVGVIGDQAGLKYPPIPPFDTSKP